MCYSRCGKVKEAEDTFRETALAGVKPTTALYNSLLHAYIATKDVLMAERVFAGIRRAGLVPDVGNYTSMIFVYQKCSDFPKCWDTFKRADLANCVDSYLVSYMVRICSYVFSLSDNNKK